MAGQTSECILVVIIGVMQSSIAIMLLCIKNNSSTVRSDTTIITHYAAFVISSKVSVALVVLGVISYDQISLV